VNETDLISIHRLERAAHDLGHYNLAKLLRAAVASAAIRALNPDDLPRTDALLVAELERAEALLARLNLPDELIDALRGSCAAVAGGGMALLADAPPASVCRCCGHVALNRAPEACPECGAGGLTFEAFPPVYYLEPEAPDLALQHLRAMPGALDRLLAGLSEAQIAQKIPGAEGEWSLREAAGHLLDANGLLARRVELLLTQTEPDLKPKAVWQNPEATAAPQTSAAIAAAFRREREAVVARLAAISAEDWQRAGRHDEFGRVTLLQQAAYFAKHEHWHLAQMTRLRAALSRNGPG
jgi:hypothetical protein